MAWRSIDTDHPLKAAHPFGVPVGYSFGTRKDARAQTAEFNAEFDRTGTAPAGAQ